CAHVAMRKAVHGAEREARTIDDAGVIQFVGEEVVVTADERRDDAEVGLVAGAEYERCLLIDELRESFLELLVQIQCAVQEPAAGAATAVLSERLLACLQHLRVMRQSEVVVR